MRVIGLTGGIATGKSTVATAVKLQGLHLIDCDEIAKAVVRKVCPEFSLLSLNKHEEFASYLYAIIINVSRSAFGYLCTAQTTTSPPLTFMQGRWGHKRVVAAFGDDILLEDGAFSLSASFSLLSLRLRLFTFAI